MFAPGDLLEQLRTQWHSRALWQIEAYGSEPELRGMTQPDLAPKTSLPAAIAKEPTMIYRTLGKSVERVSAIVVGVWYLGLSHVVVALAILVVRMVMV